VTHGVAMVLTLCRDDAHIHCRLVPVKSLGTAFLALHKDV